MSDVSNIRPVALSRRLMLRGFAFTAGGAALLRLSMSGAAAQSKMAQKTAGYQENPQGAAECDNCTHFAAPSSCNLVEGDILPTGWCRLHTNKSA
ncbi:MAG TPA: hypothetical protein VKS60_22565 [Stellaceae bacterium]|nr:hypothetical protein [Stellaceae bacterium]